MALRNHNPLLRNTDIIWRDKRYSNNVSNLVEYIGKTVVPNASTSTGDLWWIWKITYSGIYITRIQMDRGNWDDRASLDWT